MAALAPLGRVLCAQLTNNQLLAGHPFGPPTWQRRSGFNGGKGRARRSRRTSWRTDQNELEKEKKREKKGEKNRGRNRGTN